MIAGPCLTLTPASCRIDKPWDYEIWSEDASHAYAPWAAQTPRPSRRGKVQDANGASWDSLPIASLFREHACVGRHKRACPCKTVDRNFEGVLTPVKCLTMDKEHMQIVVSRDTLRRSAWLIWLAGSINEERCCVGLKVSPPVVPRKGQLWAIFRESMLRPEHHRLRVRSHQRAE